MSDQPEALRLADRLEGRWALHPEMQEAAAELRRQHDEIEQLKAERDAAVAVLETVLRIPFMSDADLEQLQINCKAAIDAARGEK